MIILGNYYRDIEHNYKLMHYYYSKSMKINRSFHTDPEVYFQLGYYYYHIMNNYPVAERCYLEALRFDNSNKSLPESERVLTIVATTS